MNISNDFKIFKFILEKNKFFEIEGSTKNRTYFRNNHGNVISVDRAVDYNANYLAELADQAGYKMDRLIEIFEYLRDARDNNP